MYQFNGLDNEGELGVTNSRCMFDKGKVYKRTEIHDSLGILFSVNFIRFVVVGASNMHAREEQLLLMVRNIFCPSGTIAWLPDMAKY